MAQCLKLDNYSLVKINNRVTVVNRRFTQLNTDIDALNAKVESELDAAIDDINTELGSIKTTYDGWC